MDAWANANADAIALALTINLIGLAALVVAGLIEHLRSRRR